ncbi:uncharacterized protein LOC143280414 [Babylonia areolata]|uniref:uncharacterized protein LOC143280414 n=1 Tax=Babylonia areolata TaxID=304850 RepID=UPI003FCF898F
MMSSRAMSRSNSAKQRGGSSLAGGEEEGGGGRAQWSQQAYSLEDVAQTFTLPLVVRCQAASVLTRRDSPLPLNLAHPVMLHSQRTIRKLLARNVLMDPRTRRYTETDETIVIPSDYAGHFLCLKSRTAKDQAVHRSVESLSAHSVTAFVNLTQLTTFQLPPNTSPSNSYPQLDFAPGNVFIPDRPVRGSTRIKGGLLSPSNKHELHYLRCRDERDVEVLVPMNQPGEFVEILRNPHGNGKLSMTSSEIVATQKFPMLVRYVYGGAKPRLTAFSGLLTLLDSFEETSLVGCVIDGSSFTLLEIPLSSPLMFQIALNNSDLMHLPLLKQASRVCEFRAANFTSDLKFKFKFAIQVPELSRGPEPSSDDDDPLSATNSTRLGITQTYIYL